MPYTSPLISKQKNAQYVMLLPLAQDVILVKHKMHLILFPSWQVKMAEETVKRVTGNPMFHAMSEISSIGISSFDGSPSDTSTDAAVPLQDDPCRRLYQPASSNPVGAHDIGVNNGLADVSHVDSGQQNSPSLVPPAIPRNKIGRSESLQRVASLEHLQKRICGVQANGEQ